MNISLGKKGVTLLELILVLVIVAIGCGLTFPKVQIGIENQGAKKALETMRTISNAIRSYELDHGNLLDDTLPAPQPIDLADLQTAGYVNPSEYSTNFSCGSLGSVFYSINTTVTPAQITARNAASGRTITLTQSSTVKGQDGVVTDSGGFLNPTS